ncbi:MULTISPECIES: NAD(P)H-dependent flavin oxidoreductase [unclassified Sphingobium]|uniref:NAD(P)H-dependent flavin oxidoreductase n=1 Tax=unclassified Sphingobium TaxID=2611147 RepID=UPI0007702089|nr:MULTISPECIES: nitronate monooxygenase family protein [unclassified Sphingobium]AMK23793.1 2-nitropropane dioxygenase [Sphingobium sp. TKS]NML89556.1 nitronate monooxygenase [Sphingobium sp. TB-6]
MSLPAFLEGRLSLPLIGSPMFIVSQPTLVIAQCRAGIIGAFPSLNARPSGVFEQWLQHLGEALTDKDAPFAVNLIVHKTNSRLEEDLALCVKYRVPIVITSLGAREDVNKAVHSSGGIVLHDVINNGFARKAIEKGADGLIAVAAGAGGHAGTLSPFALVEEIRAWFDGPLALSGAIATGRSIAAARMMGADFAYMGSPFIATEEANAEPAYKQMIVDSGAGDIVYSDYFTGVLGNYLRPSIAAAGLDADKLPKASDMDFSSIAGGDKKAWRDVWGAGQGIGAIRQIQSATAFIAQLKAEYQAAVAAFGA